MLASGDRLKAQLEDHATPEHSRPFAGRVAVVTGAARGLGYAIATTLAERGAVIVLNGTDGEALKRASDSLRAAVGGAQVRGVMADVSLPEDVSRLVEEAERELGHVDVLVNNAAIQVATGLLEHSIEDWDRVIAVNLRGVFLCMRAVLPGMIRAGHGSIVNLASIAALHATTPHISYAASKAAVLALTRDVACEVAPHGIRVNAVAPGPIETPLTGALLGEDAREVIRRAIPLGRWGTPDDIAAAVAFLASDEAAFVTGAMLPVSGGADLRLGY